MVVGLHLLRRSYFLPLAKKRRETVLFLPRKESGYRTQRPSALESPLPPLHKPNLKKKKSILFKVTTTTSACTSPGLKNYPLYIQSLPEHCLRLKRIGKIFLSKRALKTEPAPCRKSPQEGPHPRGKKKRQKKEKGKQKREKERKIIVIRRILQIQNVSLEAK